MLWFGIADLAGGREREGQAQQLLAASEDNTVYTTIQDHELPVTQSTLDTLAAE